MFRINLVALVITSVIALVWLRLNDFFAHRGWISSQLSRKIIHVGTGPIFVLCWLFFNDLPSAPFIAAVVPLGITFQFALVGSGVIKDPSAVEAMSRTGERREILRGPLFYGIAFVVLTILFWRTSPVGIVALMTLCGGDGLADIVGKRFGRVRLPWSPQKTITGSLAMILGSFVFSTVIVWVFVNQGYLTAPFRHYILPIGLISFASMAVESLPFSDIDNISVPLTAVLLGWLLF